ncbi:hypothetical protein PRZ48_006120 [Zasmidium cellare]|uniref:Apple domain-containing protein n=1 Tax=Zasmidium cellare TaxID=395010 RepID=A0ABR0EMU9_ZASCE|nr:hypothetical protein PRZ48_006120 [Zasmidium cellare]
MASIVPAHFLDSKQQCGLAFYCHAIVIQLAICPAYDGKTYSDPSGAQYNLACDTAYSGTTIPAKIKRSSPATVQDCMASCDSIDACIAITYASGQCSLLSAVSGQAKVVGATAAYKALALKTSSSSTLAASTRVVTTSAAVVPTTTVKPSSTFSTLTKPTTSSTKASTASATPTIPAGQNPDWLPSDIWGQISNWFGQSQGGKPSAGQAPPSWSPSGWGGKFPGGYRGPNGEWHYKG